MAVGMRRRCAAGLLSGGPRRVPSGRLGNITGSSTVETSYRNSADCCGSPAGYPPPPPAGGGATGELLLHDEIHLDILELLGEVLGPAPYSLTAPKRVIGWIGALRALGNAAGLTFRDPATLAQASGRTLADGSACRLAGHDVFRKLELIGRFLGWSWFADSAGGLREIIDLSKISTKLSAGPGVVWLVCSSSAQQKEIEADFPRVVVVYHRQPNVRRALVWASGGMEVAKGPPLKYPPDFAAKYVIALGIVG